MADPSSLAYHWGEFEQVKVGSKTATKTMSSASKARGGGGGGSWEDLRKEVRDRVPKNLYRFSQ